MYWVPFLTPLAKPKSVFLTERVPQLSADHRLLRKLAHQRLRHGLSEVLGLQVWAGCVREAKQKLLFIDVDVVAPSAGRRQLLRATWFLSLLLMLSS